MGPTNSAVVQLTRTGLCLPLFQVETFRQPNLSTTAVAQWFRPWLNTDTSIIPHPPFSLSFLPRSKSARDRGPSYDVLLTLYRPRGGVSRKLSEGGNAAGSVSRRSALRSFITPTNGHRRAREKYLMGLVYMVCQNTETVSKTLPQNNNKRQNKNKTKHVPTTMKNKWYKNENVILTKICFQTGM